MVVAVDAAPVGAAVANLAGHGESDLTHLALIGMSRRWSQGVGSWLTGVPLLAGPASVFVCLDQCAAIGGRTAGTTAFDMWSSCVFCLAYYAAAERGWVATSLASVIAFEVTTTLPNSVSLSVWLVLAGVLVGVPPCLGLISASVATFRMKPESHRLHRPFPLKNSWCRGIKEINS